MGYSDKVSLALGWGNGGAVVGCTQAVSQGATICAVLLISSFKKAKQVGRYLSFHW